jgi:O-acetyl-ADP-ribose deacetylase (regulator of RNase III)
MTRVSIREGDLTEMAVDAIVNAANTELVLGTGVAGAIRERGGAEIQAECDAIGPIALGDAAVTTGGTLPASYVIHAAGMEPGGKVSEESLRGCTRRSLELADERGFETIAFPAIGSGVGGFPLQRCAEVMFEVVDLHTQSAEAQSGSLREISFVLWGEPSYRLFEQVRDAQKIRQQLEKLRSR